MALVGVGLPVIVATPAAAAAEISISKSAPGSVLAGEPVTYTLTASNPGTEVLYNISFRDLLPDGVRYVSGSTSPADAGEPKSSTVNPGTGEQTVVWSNVADISPGSTTSITFEATFDTTIYPVGASFTNNASTYGSINPRTIPRFLPNGLPIPSASVVNASTTAGPTVITAITIDKSEVSPESELLRGVHDNPTVYTLVVQTNDAFAMGGVVVTDYIPAALEFLGCGGVDNTRIDSSTGNPTEEYPGSGSLAATPTPSNCRTPVSVTTVTNPGTIGGTVYPPGIYTRVQWDLGSLPPGTTTTISYAAGVPLLANTNNWSARPGGAPSGASGLQTANLDNNTGPSTRETTTEQSATNVARVTGNYPGPLAPGTTNPISDDATHTVTLEDVRLLKTVSPELFMANQIATFTLQVDTSEYVNASAIVLTDVLPNGMCPLSASTNYTAGTPLDCAPIASADPVGASYASVTQQPSGTFTLTFTPLAIAADGTATVTFKARMRETYTGGPLAGTPTSSGDEFTNHADLTATTVGIPGTGQPLPQPVADTSEVTQQTDPLTLDKLIQPRAVPQNCADSTYVDAEGIAAPGFDQSSVVFRKGDRVCFALRVDFPATTAARNVVITDVVPDGTTYEAGSNDVASGGVPVAFNEADAASGVDNPTWRVGYPAGADTVVPVGTVLRIRFSVIVDHAADTTDVDITDNLMKMRSTSSTGKVVSYRDAVPFGIAPAPPVPVVKGVASVNGDNRNAPPAPINPPATGLDDQVVAEGDVVTFRVDVTNGSVGSDPASFSIRGLQVWDVLPAGISCAQISAISAVSTAPGAPVGTCTNPGDPLQPTFSLNATRSAIVWNFRTGVAGDPDGISPGSTRTLTYTMLVPTPSSVAARYDNTAYVRSFDAFTNLTDVTATYFPSNNVDTTVDPADYDGEPSEDVSSVVLPNATFTKSRISTSVVEQNNTLAQAVNGELVTYLVRLDVPARTSIFNGSITDALPASLSFVSSALSYFPDAASVTTAAPPAGVTFTAGTGALSLGNPYTNSTATTQRFEITVVGRVTPSTGAGGKTNTAIFRRTPLLANVNPITTNRTASVTVIVPNPLIDKTSDAGTEVRAGQLVTYTLRATNQVGAPPTHDTVVVDCVPGGLTFQSYGVPTQGLTLPPTAGDGISCPIGSTRLQWDVGTVLGGTTAAPDAGETLTYVVEVDPSAAGGKAYTNTTNLTGSSLQDGVNDPTQERVVTSNDSVTVTVTTAAVLKSVTPDHATIGERVTYTVRVAVPTDVNFYDAAVLDRLPAGIDAGSVQLISATCIYVPAAGTCTVDGTPMVSVAQPDGSTKIGWLVGDLLSSPDERLVELVYSAVVADNPGPSPVRNDLLVNGAQTAWFQTQDPSRPTPTVDTTFDSYGVIRTATVTVLEPDVSVSKVVSDATPQPGDSFTYTVTFQNSSAANVSTAYDLTAVDAVPNGVVVTTPVPGGTFTPDADPSDGGGTIAWTVDQLAPGASTTRTYSAVLADSPLLSGASLVNSVQVTDFYSLDGDAGRSYACPNCPPPATAIVTPDFPVLDVTKTAVDGAPTYIGQPYLWRVTVANTGGGDARSVDAADTLPPNWRYVPGSSVVTSPSGTVSVAPDSSTIVGVTQTLTWNDLSDLAPGQSLTVEFRAVALPAVVDDLGVGSGIAQLNSATAVAVDAAGFPGHGTPLIPYADTATAADEDRLGRPDHHQDPRRSTGAGRGRALRLARRREQPGRRRRRRSVPGHRHPPERGGPERRPVRERLVLYGSGRCGSVRLPAHRSYGHARAWRPVPSYRHPGDHRPEQPGRYDRDQPCGRPRQDLRPGARQQHHDRHRDAADLG